MGGEVGVNSAPNLGSTFWFEARFPMGSALATDTETTNFAGPPTTGLQGRSLLVVDDNEFNLEVARGLLEAVGASVQTANDGAQAVEMLRAQPFDCVLMDVQMPVMDGLEATRRIRADTQLSSTLVIAMTANASGTDRAHCLEAGMNEVIKKPVEPEKMYRILAGQLQSHSFPVGPSPIPLTGLITHEPSNLVPIELARWDRQMLQSFVGNTPGRQAKLLATFLGSAVECVRSVGQAIDSQDWSAAGAQGHKLKSSSRCVGAMQLAEFCESLERAGNSGNAQTCRNIAVRVHAEFAEVKALMDCETVPV
jgi:CheY-like chemotaxis protein